MKVLIALSISVALAVSGCDFVSTALPPLPVFTDSMVTLPSEPPPPDPIPDPTPDPTQPPGPPGPPTVDGIIQPVTLTWNPPTTYADGSPLPLGEIVRYVYLIKDENNAQGFLNKFVTENTVILPILTPGTYTASVFAETSTLRGPVSNLLLFTVQ